MIVVFHLHFYRGRPISEDLSLLTSSHLLSTSPLRPHTALDVFPLALCRKTFLPDITMTDHPIHHIDLTMLKENILEVSGETQSHRSEEIHVSAPFNFQVYFNSLQICLTDMPGPPPHHHPNQRLPPPGMGAEHPPWSGGQHPEFGPPPHGFNGHSPHMRHRQHPVQDDPSLVPNVPYFDLPAGLMAPLVKVSPLLLIVGQGNENKYKCKKTVKAAIMVQVMHFLYTAVLLFSPSHTHPYKCSFFHTPHKKRYRGGFYSF